MKPETPRPQPPRTLSSWLIVGILGLGGAVLLALGICLLVPALRSVSWPTVPGVITGHRIESSYQQKSQLYKVGVNYSFQAGENRVSGHLFSHSSAALPISFRSREAAESAYASAPDFQEWQAGRAVTVHYDPLHPEEAVLQQGAYRLALAVTLLGAFLVFVAGREWYKLRRKAAIS